MNIFYMFAIFTMSTFYFRHENVKLYVDNYVGSVGPNNCIGSVGPYNNFRVIR